ncbi:protein-S-isoprenylcysteine O-methyltransferase Ste14 [Tamaricihabitans halophyticus]|uniref:Protein-S-isoprenylcysteine O-methyltransferase Ste14 n=1 Tax=Tamaricihabitans halophyticus TaxID=1262583 RepID=A0A4V6NRF7_9PSEU|nr:isoprenylcysteine carboxylmethyltransferase family protein [Tamaricihabitans halophyticus]TCP56266.1 protein-S-isoprenylcysteine O-methyltransferase Ste14 [Tamaricihabitans halophyticus]
MGSPKGFGIPPLALVGLAAVIQRALPGRAATRSRTAVAGLLAGASAWLLGTSVSKFRKSETTVNPIGPAEATSLVVDGPNRVSRNPMYVGMAGMLTAHAVFRGSWLASVPAGAFVLLIDRAQIPAEEAALRARFGSAYEEYRSRVPRWLGPTRR